MAFRNLSNFILSLALMYLISILMPNAYDIFVKFSVAIVAIKLAEWLMAITRKYFLFSKVSCKNKAIFITGCDTGFGHMLAKRMDGLGYRVFAGCLFPTDAGAKNLTNNCSSNLLVVPLDVTNDESVNSAKEFVVKNLKNDVLWAVVNNAGVSQAGEIDWTPFSELRRVSEVNTFGTVRVTKAFLSLLKQSKGRLVNVTSFADFLLGQVCSPGYVGYCMSKSAALSFTTGLRMEMAKWGVKVISIEPFFYATPITKAQTTIDLIERTWAKSPLEIQEDYGEEYKENIQESCARLLAKCSHKIDEVVDCLEDAITAQEPLAAYFPSYLPHKIVFKFLSALPFIVTEICMKAHFNQKVKPAALMKCRKEQIITSPTENNEATSDVHQKVQ